MIRKKQSEYKYIYIISSERAHIRKDEYRRKMYGDTLRHAGDVIYLDGMAWTIEEVQNIEDKLTYEDT